MRPSNDSGYLNLARLSVSLLRRQSRERGAESMCAPGGARARDEPMSSPSGSPSEGEVRRKSEDEYQSAALRGPTAVVARPGTVQPRWLAETSSWGDRLRLAACLRGRVVLPQSLALEPGLVADTPLSPSVADACGTVPGTAELRLPPVVPLPTLRFNLKTKVRVTVEHLNRPT